MEYLHKCIESKIPVMPIFIISCNNLAETYCLMKRWDKADKMIKRGIYYILFLNKQELHPQSESMLSNWLFKQMLLYKEFTDRSGQPNNYGNLLEKLKG